MTKLTSHGEAWQGNWRARLAAELERRGANSLRAFADENDCRTYTAIASALDGPFAPIQMVTAMRSEFETQGDLSGFVADSLFRYLLEYTAAPIDQKRLRESQAAEAISACGAALGAEHEEAILEVWSKLREKIVEGWLPDSPSDPVVQNVVSSAFCPTGR
jgi:hypothetical protein